MPYTSSDVLSGNAHGGKIKVLLMGVPKGGKSCAAVLTSPSPVFVVNADPGGLAPPASLGAKFDAEDCFDWSTLQKTVNQLKKDTLGSKPRYRTVVVDTLTLLSQHLESEIKRQGMTGWDIYRELKDRMLGALSTIIGLPVHIILTAHALETSGDTGSMGVLPAMSGQAKVFVPALCQDWLWLEVTPAKDKGEVKREFLLEAQGNWKHGCRSIQHGGRMDADFTAFIKKVGLKP